MRIEHDVAGFPMRDEAVIERIRVVEPQDRCGFVQLVADLRESARQPGQQRGPAVGRDSRQCRRQNLAERRRHQRNPAPEAFGEVITVIACEQFVAAIPGQRDGYVLAGHRRDQISRNLRRVREGLVVPFWQSGNDVERFL